jgi:hypothetical protein
MVHVTSAVCGLVMTALLTAHTVLDNFALVGRSHVHEFTVSGSVREPAARKHKPGACEGCRLRLRDVFFL